MGIQGNQADRTRLAPRQTAAWSRYLQLANQVRDELDEIVDLLPAHGRGIAVGGESQTARGDTDCRQGDGGAAHGVQFLHGQSTHSSFQ